MPRNRQDVFGGLLEVRLKGTWWWSLGLTWPAAPLRGLDHSSSISSTIPTS